MSKIQILKLKDQFFVSCPLGLENVLAKEVKKYKGRNIVIERGGVHFDGVPEIALQLIIFSRIASRIFKKVYTFEFKDEKDLYFGIKDIKWPSLIELEQTFKITVNQNKSNDGSKRSKYHNTLYLSQRIKDGIVDHFKKKLNDRPNVDTQAPDVSIFAHIRPVDNPHSQKETITISLDLTGISLDKRGYRIQSGEAPLRENLAAGILALADYDPKKTLIDPMCGTGTLIIEALLKAGDIPPTYLTIRDIKDYNDPVPWDFYHHQFFKKNKYLVENFLLMIDQAYEQSKEGIKKLSQTSLNKFIAYDQASEAISAISKNLDVLGLQDFVVIKRQSLADFHNPGLSDGQMITNPPYGQRIGEEEELEKLYHDFGEILKNQFKGFHAYIFTGNPKLLKKISLRTSRKHIVFNGKLECRLAEYELH